ncbi:MAG TPA: L-alanine-DL-glutamate epimerase, partial [Clostridiales bacterium]|nr:L-alanine-DL-glutamate epimerase [Clostridiales bacterium]
MKIIGTKLNFEREPFKAPFGFKGKYLYSLWQIVVELESKNGNTGLGVGVQSVLWSDSNVFSQFSPEGGNAVMFLLTEYALKHCADVEWETPVELLDYLYPKVIEYGKKLTSDSMRDTFALNALVPVDLAAWQLYAAEKDITNFDDMIGELYQPALSTKHEQLACIPLVNYSLSDEDILDLVKNGYFFFKIKVGNDPDKDGSVEKMLDWDKKRIKQIHELLKDIEIPWTSDGYIPYYLDANGRYPNKHVLKDFLDYADSIGALERIIIFEEPFPEEYKENISDLPVRIAADESAHTVKDVLERIELGYKAVALKPIAKTLSMSLQIAKVCKANHIPCFCADLTVPPVMVEWNKCVAARLDPLPGMKIGVLETNGHQNYKNWDLITQYHPYPDSVWGTQKAGL